MSGATTARRRQQAPNPRQETELTGYIERAVFTNPENGYAVVRVRPSGNGEETTAVGHLPRIREGDQYRFTGSWKEHPRFGRQFVFTSCELLVPTGRAGIVAYLSEIAAGVGPVRASRIVDALGDNALERIQAEPRVLEALDFLTPKQRDAIQAHLAENRILADLTALICRQAGVTPALAARIYRRYGPESVQVVKQNPYLLADEVWGVGFITADKVARAVGVAPDSEFRVRAAIEHALREACGDGHCYLRPRDILPTVLQLLGPEGDVEVPAIAAACEHLVREGLLVREDSAIYLRRLHDAEQSVAGHLRALASAEPRRREGLEAAIARAEQAQAIEYAPKQRQAIAMALVHGLSVITGGPGTGKTTVTRAIAAIYLELEPHKSIHLASPTGRAAKRLAEASGLEARTIHRLLEYHPELGFRRDAENPLEPGLVILDEYSMVDLELAAHLFDALIPGHQVVLVGDADQLPSVGPGSILRDIIASGVVPVTHLDYVYRQVQGSQIHLWAHQIREGRVPQLTSGEDVTVVECQTQELAAAEVVKIAREAAQRYGLLGFQVLAPMRRGTSGVTALNEAVRAAVNPHGDEIRLGGTVYRMGDKVMVIKNDYDLEVFNGDIGQVVGLRKHAAPGAQRIEHLPSKRDAYLEDEEGEDEDDGPAVTVDILGRGRVIFTADKSHLLTLAYASTVHKCQGSEFPLVVVVLTRGHYVMLQRNLLYTAITRAKRHLVVVHQPGALERAVQNDRIAERHSRLAERLRTGA